MRMPIKSGVIKDAQVDDIEQEIYLEWRFPLIHKKGCPWVVTRVKFPRLLLSSTPDRS